jgi:hypothetical protein
VSVPSTRSSSVFAFSIRFALALAVTLAAHAVQAQPWEAVASGRLTAGCHILAINIPYVQWWWYGGDPEERSRLDQIHVQTIASPDRTNVFALINSPARIVRLSPDGSQATFSVAPAGITATDMAIAPGGRIFLAAYQSSTQKLLVISPAGVPEATYDWAVPPDGFEPALAVAADGCTLLYNTGTAIARVNGCTGAPLPPFTELANVQDVEPQTDGTVLVAAGNQVLLFSGGGALIRTIASISSFAGQPFYDPGLEVQQVARRNDLVWMMAGNPCDSGFRVAVRFTDGGVVTWADSVINNATALILGPVDRAETIPTLAEMALVLLAFALAAAGSLVLRLR